MINLIKNLFRSIKPKHFINLHSHTRQSHTTCVNSTCEQNGKKLFTFSGVTSICVICEGSIMGRARDVSLPIIPAHCAGSPTKTPCSRSNPVCTRCWKLEGLEISSPFFLDLFLPNMVAVTNLERKTNDPIFN